MPLATPTRVQRYGHSQSVPSEFSLPPTICVVDTKGTASFNPHEPPTEARFRFVNQSGDALRLAATERIDLWVVNAYLAGLSGTDLCRMLKARDRHARVVLIADEHSDTLERSALAAGATMFIVQPTAPDEFIDWLAQSAAAPPSA
jgi:DNA-binding NarL/FixJ family response regulator